MSVRPLEINLISCGILHLRVVTYMTRKRTRSSIALIRIKVMHQNLSVEFQPY